MLKFEGFVITDLGKWIYEQRNFRINYQQPSHGTISGPAFGVGGQYVSLSNTPSTGYAFSTYTVDGSTLSGSSFLMPYREVTVSGAFTAINYTVNISQPSNGTISSTAATAHYGDTVTLTNSPNTGYELDHYTVNGNTIQGNTFTMPAGDVTVSAVFKAKTYTITKVNPSGGTITVAASATYGSTVTISISTTADWELNYYTVNGTQISGNSFTMPAQNVTVSAVLKAATRTYRSDFIYITSKSQFNNCYDLTAAAAGSGVSVEMYVWIYDGLLANGSWKRWSRYGNNAHIDCSLGSASPFTLTNSNTNTLTVQHTGVGTQEAAYVRFEFRADHDIRLYLSNFREEYHGSYGNITVRYYTGSYDRTGSPAQSSSMTTNYTTDPFYIGTTKV